MTRLYHPTHHGDKEPPPSHMAPLVWVPSSTSLHEKTWEPTIVQYEVSNATWRWCTNFVVPLHLCPWAALSVNTQGAVRIYITSNVESEMEDAVRQASIQLRDDVEEGKVDANVAIAFIVTSDEWDFVSFYDWFVQWEERFLEEGSLEDTHDNDNENRIDYSSMGNYVTLAPFHPDWEFGGSESLPCEVFMEKQSPYPTVTVVCTSVIDKAGPEATAQIAAHNERILINAGLDTLQQLYQGQVRQSPPPSQQP